MKKLLFALFVAIILQSCGNYMHFGNCPQQMRAVNSVQKKFKS